MKCPFCRHEDTQVKDSRPSDDASSIRRRRECAKCDARFTTFERVHLRDLYVLKSNGLREPFDRDKLTRSLKLALQKRPVTEEIIERTVNDIVRTLEAMGDMDIPTQKIGECAMKALSALDLVAYVRYASVYKDFHEVRDFSTFLGGLENKRKAENG